LASYLGISTRTFDRLNGMGMLPAPDLVIGSSARWAPQTVAKWLKSRPRLPGRKAIAQEKGGAS
jgi:hypothetical protein